MLYTIKDEKMIDYEIPNGRIILVGIPGAFTNGCTKRHLPGYVNAVNAMNVDKIVFVSVNDAFVMSAWGRLHGNQNIDFVADPFGKFTEYMDKSEDLTEYGLGIRSKRYAVLMENGSVIKEFKSPFAEDVYTEMREFENV